MTESVDGPQSSGEGQSSIRSRRSSVDGRQSQPATLSEAEALAAATLVFGATVMIVAWAADGIGLPVHPPAVLVVALVVVALTSVALGRRLRAFSPSRLAGFLLVVLGFAAYVCWLGWPSLLPITQGPDLVHHLSLVHFIQRRHALPHDPALGAYLGEMVSYTPGSHLLAALAGEWLRVDAIRIVHPLQATAVGVKAGVVFCALMRLRRSRGGASVPAAVAGTSLLLLPHRYLLEPITVYGFYSQVIAETFAVGILWTIVAWHQRPSRVWLALAGVCGAGLVLSWPVYLPATALAVALVVLFRWRMRGRTLAEAAADLLLALGPPALIVITLSLRHASSAGILRSGGSVIVPSADVFGWAFLLLAIGGVALARRRWRVRFAILAFAVACTAQIIALALVQAWLGATNLYLAHKTVFLLVYPLAVLAALALRVLMRPLSVAGGAPVRLRLASVVSGPLVVAALLAFRALPLRPLHSPISHSVYQAGVWAKAHVPASCVDYMAEHWVTGYWLHLDVLGNPRASRRMQNETFEHRPAVSRWILPGGPPYAIVEDLSAVPADARRTMHVLHHAGAAAVVERTDGMGGCAPVPSIDAIGH